jgi:hypothetical protein
MKNKHFLLLLRVPEQHPPFSFRIENADCNEEGDVVSFAKINGTQNKIVKTGPFC